MHDQSVMALQSPQLGRDLREMDRQTTRDNGRTRSKDKIPVHTSKRAAATVAAAAAAAQQRQRQQQQQQQQQQPIMKQYCKSLHRECNSPPDSRFEAQT